MANKNIQLKKTIISNKSSNDSLSKNFDKLVKSNNIANSANIKPLYENLFYSIPKEGNPSHNSILDQSIEYIDESEIEKLDLKIDQLLDKYSELETDYENALTPKAEHPLYPNGSFITAGDPVLQQQFQGMSTIYLMNQGLKRTIKNITGPNGEENVLYYTLRRILGKSEDFETDIIYLSIDDLNTIPNGPPINSFNDLNVRQLTSDNDQIYQRLQYYKLYVKCEGMLGKVYAPQFTPSWTISVLNDQNEGSGCKISYIDNDFDDPTGFYKIKELTLKNDEQAVIWIARDTFFEGETELALSGIPDDFDEEKYNEYLPQYLSEDDQVGLSQPYNYYPSTKEWGYEKRFNGIVSAYGELEYKQVLPGPKTGWKKLNQHYTLNFNPYS